MQKRNKSSEKPRKPQRFEEEEPKNSGKKFKTENGYKKKAAGIVKDFF
jgi:hypothetical protein